VNSMKFLRVNNKKIYLSLLVLTQVFLLLKAFGSGYNGPDFSGSAIPIHLDRAFTIEDLHRAYQTCYKREIVDIFTKLHCGSVPFSDIKVSLREHGYSELHAVNNCFHLTAYSDNYEGKKSGGLNWLFPDGSYVSQNIGETNHTLPYFSYDTEVKVGAKDQHGRLIDKSRVLLKNLRLVFYSNESKVELNTNEKGVKLKADYTVNLKAYGDCLRSEIYK